MSHYNEDFMAKMEKTPYPDERRVFERRHLVFYLRIFDGMSSKVLGHLVDISTRGAMLVCDAPVSLNQDFRLRMRLPTEIGGRSELLIEGTSRWCKPDTNPDFFVVGFKLAKLDSEYEGYIKQLIADFSIEDSVKTQSADQPACNLTSTAGR